MKRFLFTILTLVALVMVANTAFGAETNPYVNTTHTYSITLPLTNANDTYAFSVNSSTTDPDAANAGGSLSNTGGSIPANGEVSTDVTWGSNAATYYLWVKVTDDNAGTNCSNQRYIAVTVKSNLFDLTIIPLGNSEAADHPNYALGTPDAIDCPVFVGADFEADGSDTDGSTWSYFKVVKNSSNGTATWGFSVTPETGTAYYSADGTTWNTTAPSGLASTTTSYRVRIVIANTAAEISADATVVGLEGGTLADGNSTNNTATFTISSMPALNGISFD